MLFVLFDGVGSVLLCLTRLRLGWVMYLFYLFHWPMYNSLRRLDLFPKVISRIRCSYRRWLLVSILLVLCFCCIWILPDGFDDGDGGKYMIETDELRDLATLITRPWQVEETVRNGICSISPNKMKWGLVSVVKSAVANRNRRDVIRATWGEICAVDDVIMRIVFVVGTSDNVTAMKQLQEENEKFGDILLYDKTDEPRFVPIKILAGMQWATEILRGRWLYSSTDDDILVHVPHLVDYLSALVSDYDVDNMPLSCIYSYQDRDPPARDPNSKWFISKLAFPGRYWPTYCRGGMYVTSASMNKRLFGVSRRTALLYLDDVWITGFMRRKLGDGDDNIVAAPGAKKSNDGEYFKEQDPKTALVQHMWGNIEEFRIDVPNKLRTVWKLWKSGFVKSAEFCTLKSP